MKRAAFVLIVAAGAGCNGSRPPPDRSATAAAVEAFCLQYWAKRAERNVSCQGKPAAESNGQAAVACAALRAAALDGGLDIDAERAAICLASLEIAGCLGSGVADVRACREILRGTRPSGAACRRHNALDFFVQECRPDAWCSSADARPGQCGGRCQPLRGEGESCADRGCVGGLHCRQGLCRMVTPAGVGESCAGPSENPGPSCAAGLVCDQPGICRRLQSLAVCSSSADCEQFKRCVGGSCVLNLDGPCAENGCAADRACIQGRCAPLPALDDPCVPEGAAGCPPGAFCHEGTCRPRLAEGEPCVGVYCSPGNCAEGLECRGGVCARKSAAGEACDIIDPMRCCAAGLDCVSGRCEALDPCY